MKTIGFNGPKPHSVIIWMMNGEPKAKTVCYSADDEIEALDRHMNDKFYSQFKPLIVKEGF